MANIIKKISGVDLSGNTVIADAAVTNMYTDQNGDLNIKTSTELGDTDDSKVVITSKEINLNADTVKINNTPIDASEIADNFDILSDFTRDVEYAVTNHSARIDDIETSVSTLQDDATTLTERVESIENSKPVEISSTFSTGKRIPITANYTYNGLPISHFRITNTGPNEYNIVFCIGHTDAGEEYHEYIEYTTVGNNEFEFVNHYTSRKDDADIEYAPVYIRALFGDVAVGELKFGQKIQQGLMTLDDKNTITQIDKDLVKISKRVESLENTGILDYEPSWKEFFNTVEESLSQMNRTITWNNIAIQKIADHLNYDGIYETE